MKKQLPGWAVLLIITLAAGLALGGTYALTKEPIEQQALITAENARKAALPNADAFEELPLTDGAGVDWAYAGIKAGETVGYVAQKTVNGFGGKVEVIAGVDTSAAPDTFTVGGVSVGGANFSETAGLGARAKEAAFTDQFTGKVYPISFIKAGGTATESTVDALTSATITTTAVVNGVNDVVKYVKADILGIAGAEMPAKPADGVFSASAKGFRGPVYVEAAFDGSKIAYLSVGDESFAEDIGAGVREPDFMYQFIGMTAPVDKADVDMISGATISSTAVITALNDAYNAAQGIVVEKPVITLPEAPAEGVYGAAKQGFGGPVAVNAAFDADGRITYIKIGDDSFAETPGLGARALEDEFQIQFIGKQMPIALNDIDALSGATVTSKAVVDALNEAYDISQGKAVEPEPVQEPDIVEKPENTFGASAFGFESDVFVEAAFDGNKITWISIGDKRFDETAGLGAKVLEKEFQAQFIGKTVPLTLSDIDAVTGATFTSTAVVEALNKAYDKSLAAAAAPEAKEPENLQVAPGVYGASEQGFGGPVYVEASFDAEGKITSIKIGDDSFAETPGLGARALDDDFQAQFIGKQMPLALDGIDAIGGATVTSTAVVNALNRLYESYQAYPAASQQDQTDQQETQETLLVYEAEITSGSAVIKVKASFREKTLAALSVTPNDLENSLAEKFVGSALPLSVQQEDIDAFSAAVAINKAYGDYLAEHPDLIPTPVTEEAAPAAQETNDETKQTPGQAEAVPAAENAPEASANAEKESAMTGEAISFFTAIRVNVQTEGRVITALEVLDKPVGSEAYSESGKNEEMQLLFVGEALPLVPGDQTTAYAAAVAAAVNQAFPQAGLADGPAETGTEIMGYGSCFMFFNKYEIAASFDGNKLSDFRLFVSPIGQDVPIADTQIRDIAPLQALFTGKEMPLDPADYQYGVEGFPAYAVNAVVIAINQAYENPVAVFPL